MLLYPTPEFDSADPLVCHSIQLRPALWRVVFDCLERLAKPYAWEQVNPTDAAISDVIAEIEKATDAAIFAGCIMIGQIIELATAEIPDWCLVCDGTTYNRVDYPELYAALSENLIIDADTFKVPDRNGRFGLGGVNVGTQGGEEEHTLTTGEMPAHSHLYTAPVGEFLALGPGEEPVVLTMNPLTLTADAGGGEAHNNMPPFEQVYFVIVARYPDAA